MDKDNTTNDSFADSFNEEADNKEYERAMELLNSSKSSRMRAIQSKKKAEKKAAKPKSDPNGSFFDKCKADPVIPITIIALVLVVIGAALYFILPSLKKSACKDLGLTYPELQTKYLATDIYTQCALGDFGFEVADAPMTELDSLLTEGAVNDSAFMSTADGSKLRQYTGMDSYVVAMADSADGKLTEIRAYIALDSANENAASFVVFYFMSFLQVFEPEMTSDDLMNLISESGASLGKFFEIGDVSFSISLDANTAIYCLQIVPDSLADDYADHYAQASSAASEENN